MAEAKTATSTETPKKRTSPAKKVDLDRVRNVVVIVAAIVLAIAGALLAWNILKETDFSVAPGPNMEQQMDGPAQIPAPMHSRAKPIEDPACAMLDDNSGMRMQQKPAPNAVRVRNPVTGRCAWYVAD